MFLVYRFGLLLRDWDSSIGSIFHMDSSARRALSMLGASGLPRSQWLQATHIDFLPLEKPQSNFLAATPGVLIKLVLGSSYFFALLYFLFAGVVVFLNFIAPHCAHCIHGMFNMGQSSETHYDSITVRKITCTTRI